MFIKLTEIYRVGEPDNGGVLFVNPDHIVSMQTGVSLQGVKVTTLNITLESFVHYVAETPEQIMFLIEGDEEDI